MLSVLARCVQRAFFFIIEYMKGGKNNVKLQALPQKSGD